MPLTSKGKKIMKAMKKEYGKKKGEQVFYASRNKGKIKGVEKLRVGGVGGRAKEGPVERPGGGGGRDPSKQYQQQTQISPSQRQTLTQQRKTAIGKISPSTTPKGKLIATGIGLGIGIPFIGGKIGSRVVDYTMGFTPYAASKSKTKQKTKTFVGGEGDNNKIIKPLIVEANKPIDTSLIKPKDNFFNFVAYNYNRGGLSGGVRSGPPPKSGPNPNVPPVKMKKGGYKK